MIVLSEEGRTRFSTFPPLIADDLFLDSLYAENERAVVNDVEVTVEAPHTTRDLLRRLERVRRGNAQMRAAATGSGLALTVRRPQRWAWLTDVVLPHPRLALAGIAYVSITLTAAILARRPVKDASRTWGRDESTRGGSASSRPEGGA